MMPKKPENEKRSIMIGIKVDLTTKKKLDFLSSYENTSISTYVYNQIRKHIADKEPWITKEIEQNYDGRGEQI